MKTRARSGKFVLRIPPSLHEELSKLAQKRNESLNNICHDLLQKGLEKEEKTFPSESIPLVTKIRNIFPGTKAIVLFGSQARGEATPSSDTDLLIVLAKKETISRNLYHLWDQKIGAPDRISPQFVSLLDNIEDAGSIWLETAMEGIILWEKEDHPISRIFYLLRKEIMKGTWQRKMAHGSPYWIKHDKRRAA